MAYLALERIFVFLQEEEKASYWRDALIDAGGENGVAPEFIEAVEKSLEKISPRNTSIMESE